MNKFIELGLSEDIVSVLNSMGLKEPTDIQKKTIPLIIKGKDVIGGSATGSGKTLAFGSGIIERVKAGGGVQALVLTPTRELAEQVGKSLQIFAKNKKLNIAIIYGGVRVNPQINTISKAEIVVGTPGRTLDHLNKGTFNLKKIHIVVLDEADRMLDMGFIYDVTKILNSCPKDRQTMLFSATISSNIIHIAKSYMKEPVEISSEVYVDASKLSQIFYDVTNDKKFSLLVHLLKRDTGGLVMVFCNTRKMVDFVGKNLRNLSINAMTIHGGLTQAKRSNIMKHFHDKKIYVLVCTDVAARGLDIKGVSHIYNYDIPSNSKEYLHRIGRTARAGKEGKAISLVSQRDYYNFIRVLKDPSIKIIKEKLPEIKILKIRFSNYSSKKAKKYR